MTKHQFSRHKPGEQLSVISVFLGQDILFLLSVAKNKINKST